MPAHKTKGRVAKPAKSAQVEQDEIEERCHQGIEVEDDEDEDLLNMEIPPMVEIAQQNNGERMVISHIDVENFKSYYGKQIIGPFHKNFTSIIGPNGSGKSNVIDSLLFVFGYRATKIRSKKISVLIHSSAGHDNIQSCTVTVNFCKIVDQPDGSYKKLKGSEIAVSRMAFHDNSSRYMMNRRTVKFKEIGDLLRQNGIDLVHNRFLILQGEVEQISMMKPKAEKADEEGMLEYLEDIIGSSRLKEPIVKLHNRIEKITDRRNIQLQRLQHAEKQKAQLDGPVREVLGQMRLENAINCWNNRIMAAKRFALQDNISGLKREREEMNEELKGTQQKLSEILSKAKQVNKERQRLQNQIDQYQDAVQSTERLIGEQKQKITKSENDAKRLESKIQKLHSEVVSEAKKLKEWESAPELAKAKIEEHRQQLTEAESAIQDLTSKLIEKLAEVRVKTQEENKEKAELESRNAKLTALEDELNSKLTLTQEKLMGLRREEDDQRRKYDELHQKMLDREEQLEKNNTELSTARGALPELEQTFGGKTERVNQLRQREQKLGDRVRELRVRYEEKRQTEEQSSGANKLLNRLMEAKRSGEIEGILGRLGDLGAIDEKYDVAISTTCGPLDNIVVEDVDVGQRCIELLKRENLGQATFIILDKQQHFWPHVRQKPETPENAPRMFDLIRVADEKVLPAFYFALQDTLVADNIEMANRIGLNSPNRRWRTVTLKGELIDVSGTFTGGGNQQWKGRIGRDVRVDTSHSEGDAAKSLAQLQQDLGNAEAELVGLRRERLLLEQELQKRGEALKRTRDKCKEAELNREQISSSLQGLRNQIATQKQKVIGATANPQEVQLIEHELDGLKSESAKLAKKTDSLRAELMNVNERIERVNEEIAWPYQERMNAAEAQKKNAENGISKANATLASSERNVRKAKEKIGNLEQDIREMEKQLEAIGKRRLDAENRRQELEEVFKERKAEMETARAALNEYAQSIGEQNEEEVELQKSVDEMKRELKKMDTELANIDAKLKTLTSKIVKLKLYRLKWLTETLKNGATIVVEPEENAEEENEGEEEDGDAIDPEKEDERQNRRAAPLRWKGDDGLDKYLEDCLGEGPVETEEGEEMEEQIDITEGEDEYELDAMELDEQAQQRRNAGDTLRDRQFFMPLPQLDEKVVRSEYDVKELQQELVELEQRKKKAQINLGLIREYMEKLRKYETEFRALGALTEQRDLHRAKYDRFKKQRLFKFMDGFEHISTALRTTYQMITVQGDVSLELVDSLDPFTEGISFNVRPPKKSWKQITNLSGGEKTLASLSLVFGLHQYKPTPLYVMDEIDAALDFRNVAIISSYLLERTKNAQFIVISLRNQMYEKANRLIGIYKVADCTQNVVVDPKAMEQLYHEDYIALKSIRKSGQHTDDVNMVYG